MHTWPVHMTKQVSILEASSYATCKLEQLGKPVVDSYMLRKYGLCATKPHR